MYGSNTSLHYMQYSTLHRSHTLLPCTMTVVALRRMSRGWQWCNRLYSGLIRVVRVCGSSSGDGPELLVSQLVDRHDFCQLLSILCLVLHEVWDANVLHLSQSSQAVHVFVGHLSTQENNTDRFSNLLHVNENKVK